jgi:hypothetical protein
MATRFPCLIAGLKAQCSNMKFAVFGGTNDPWYCPLAHPKPARRRLRVVLGTLNPECRGRSLLFLIWLGRLRWFYIPRGLSTVSSAATQSGLDAWGLSREATGKTKLKMIIKTRNVSVQLHHNRLVEFRIILLQVHRPVLLLKLLDHRPHGFGIGDGSPPVTPRGRHVNQFESTCSSARSGSTAYSIP